MKGVEKEITQETFSRREEEKHNAILLPKNYLPKSLSLVHKGQCIQQLEKLFGEVYNVRVLTRLSHKIIRTPKVAVYTFPLGQSI